MAIGSYIGVDEISRKVKKEFIGIDRVARKVTKAYIGVNDIARLCYSASSTWNKYDAVTTYNWSMYNIQTTYSLDFYSYTQSLTGINKLFYSQPPAINTSTGALTAQGTTVECYSSSNIANVYLNGAMTSNSDASSTIVTSYPYYLSGNTWYKVVSVNSTRNTSNIGVNVSGYYTAKSSDTKGTYIRDVSSSSSSTYPSNGAHSDGYWYVSQSPSYSKGSTLIEVVESADANAYPENGYQNGYWYIKI